MSFGADEEILQDFLVEAGEILEQLSEQLVELESWWSAVTSPKTCSTSCARVSVALMQN
jgi:chemotaxis protein histidine kinase CheA